MRENWVCFFVAMERQRVKTRTQWYLTVSIPNSNHLHTQFYQCCAGLLFFIDYGLKCLDEQLKINNTVDAAIQYQTTSSTTMSWIVGNTSEWPTIDAYSICCPAEVETMAGNDVNGDLERQKHCITGVSWESGWQWIKMRRGTMEHKLLTTFTASTRCECEKKKTCSLIIWTFELLEPRLQPTWMLQSLIIQRWEAELQLIGPYLIPTSVCTGSSRCFLLGFCWFFVGPRACALACPPSPVLVLDLWVP